MPGPQTRGNKERERAAAAEELDVNTRLEGLFDDSQRARVRFAIVGMSPAAQQLMFQETNDEVLKEALLLAAGANKRSSGDGSKASPKQQCPDSPDALPHSGSPPFTSTHSVKLSDSKVKLLTRFTKIREVTASAEDLSAQVLSPEVVEHLLDKMLTTALRWAPTIDFSNESGLVHLIGKMMDEVTYELHPCGAPLLMVPRDEDPQIEMQIEHQGKGEEGWLVGFEQTLRAGTWKGRSELQYVQRVLDNGERIFCGAIEVKGFHTGVELRPAHVEQARKEAFTLWCHNAKQGHYQEVWILLTNGQQIMRVSYKGENVPVEANTELREAPNLPGPPKPYYDKMPCVDVYGTIAVTNQLCMWYWEQDRTSVTCTDSSHDALVLLFNTFCTKPPLDLEEIKRRNAEKEAWIKRRVDQFKREHQNKCKLKRERQGAQSAAPAVVVA